MVVSTVNVRGSTLVRRSVMLASRMASRRKAASRIQVGSNADLRPISSSIFSSNVSLKGRTGQCSFKAYDIHAHVPVPTKKWELRGASALAPQSRLLATTRSPIEAYGHGAENHNLDDPVDSLYSKYLETWSLERLISVNRLLWEDDPENDPRVAKLTVDFMKRLEMNSDRLSDLQQRVENLHSRLRNLRENRDDTNAVDGDTVQDVLHVLETERKTLRNLQRMHYDTWKSAENEYRKWSPDGDEDIDNDDDCENPILVRDPKQRKARWNAMVRTATEIQARHAMTIEQMSELVIRLKVLRSGDGQGRPGARSSSFDGDLDELYDTVCAFLRCRMTQQLLCQHLMSLGKDALGTSVARKLEEKRRADLKAGAVTGPGTDLGATGGRVVGAIHVDSPVAPVIQSSLTEASQLCEATYLLSPPAAFVLATETLVGSSADEDDPVSSTTTDAIYEGVSATFVRSWLQYTLIELLKNSMAVTVESNPAIARAAADEDGGDSDDDSDDDDDKAQQLPSLFVHVFDEEQRDTEDGGSVVVIKIYDQGGGIREDFDLDSLFRFAQRDTVWDRMDEQQTYSQVRSPLKGLGVGLSLSRWHMRHFGGDLTLERRPEGAIKLRCDSGRRSKWHVLGRGMTATITIPKDTEIPVAFS